MLLLWLFPWSWRAHSRGGVNSVHVEARRACNFNFPFSLTTLCDAKDKTELIFMAGNSRHSSSNKWDALHKASWRSLKIIVLERRLFEESQLVGEIEWRRLCKRWLCDFSAEFSKKKKSQHSIKKLFSRNKNIPVYLPQMTVVKITENKTSPFAERVAQLRPQFMATEQLCIIPLCSHNNARLTNQHLNNY